MDDLEKQALLRHLSNIVDSNEIKQAPRYEIIHGDQFGICETVIRDTATDVEYDIWEALVLLLNNQGK